MTPTQLIHLQIEEPSNGQAFVGKAPVRFKGRVSVPEELAAVPLYYRWYSSLNTSVDVGRYSINEPALNSADPAPPYEQLVPLGSQAIVFAVSDQPGETDAEFKTMRHAAVTGGEHCCLIHVFRATILGPKDTNTLSPTGLAVKALAPWTWESEDYQRINQLAYRWSVKPLGDPPGRPGFVSPKLTHDQLTFDKSDSSVTYQPALQGSGGRFEGRYEIILEVLDKADPEIGCDRASISVMFSQGAPA